MDAFLEAAQFQMRVHSNVSPDYTLDGNALANIDPIIATIGPAMRDVIEAGESAKLYSREMINQYHSIVRLLQDNNPTHVPLYTLTGWRRGFEYTASFESLTKLVRILRRTREVVGEDERRRFLKEAMGSVQEYIDMFSEAPVHIPGEEFRLTDRFIDSRTIPAFRTCRLSEDPMLEIERVTEEFVGSLDFCRGLLFRFVSREVRDQWLESFHRLYDLFEQLLLEPHKSRINTHNVRWSLLADNDQLYSAISRIASNYNRQFTGSVSHDHIVDTHELLESILVDGARRSSRCAGALKKEIYTPDGVDVWVAVNGFLVAATPILQGRKYLTLLEARRLAATARVAYWYSKRSVDNTDSETSADTVGSDSDLSVYETVLVNAYLDLVPDALAEDESAVDDFLGSRARSRTEIVLLRMSRIEESLYGEFTDKADQLITFWESYTGPHSREYLRIVLAVAHCAGKLDKISDMLVRLFEEGNPDTLRSKAIPFLAVDQLEFTNEVMATVESLLESLDKKSDVFILWYMAFRYNQPEYCDVLRDAQEVIDSIDNASDRKLARNNLPKRCSQDLL
jgi:hypothetical protein